MPRQSFYPIAGHCCRAIQGSLTIGSCKEKCHTSQQSAPPWKTSCSLVFTISLLAGVAAPPRITVTRAACGICRLNPVVTKLFLVYRVDETNVWPKFWYAVEGQPREHTLLQTFEFRAKTAALKNRALTISPGKPLFGHQYFLQQVTKWFSAFSSWPALKCILQTSCQYLVDTVKTMEHNHVAFTKCDCCSSS